MKCLLTYKLSLSLFSPEITFENTNFTIISRETITEIMCLSLSTSLRIFVNPGPGCTPTSRGVVFVEKYYSGYQSEKLVPANLPSTHAHSSIFLISHFKTSNIARRRKKRVKYEKNNKINIKYVAY